jgi:acyl-CoA reductase-like NAD-dependent aldehyde dehydrogenase
MYQQYINGNWCDAANGGIWNVQNPATEEHFATVAFGDGSDTKAAIDAAKNALKNWQSKNVYQRADILHRVADLMRERSKEYANFTTQEAGKPIAEARGEWTVAAQFFDWFAEESKRTYGHNIPANRNNKRQQVILQPIGVVGIITAWNFPVWNACRVWAAALAAGCTIVCKPSEYTPITAVLLMQCLADAGVPAGTANLVMGDADVIGKTLMSDINVRKVHFVGSTRVGKILLAAAAETNTKLSLELGGNAPVIITEDVDIQRVAVAAVGAKFRNCGQVCVSPQRFLVHQKHYEAFLSTAKNTVEKLKVGDGSDSENNMGPLINARQREGVATVVTAAIAAGARLVAGGKIPYEKGFFYAPTILADVDDKNPAFRKEIFGPVMAVTPFNDLEEALALANDTEYGLMAYVFTNDLNTSIHVSEALEFGMVGINEWTPHSIEVPFGGWKQSGLGYECGAEGILEYMEKKVIAIGSI